MSAIWATGTNVSSVFGSAVTVLRAGESVTAPFTIDSSSGEFRLQFQVEGNLVLLQMPDETVLWASGPGGDGGDTLIMQEDGNLVIYDGGIFGTPEWSSETAGNPFCYIVLQNDGNLVIYSLTGLQPYALWSIRPDWAGGSIETLDWMTSVTESPVAVEQRMGLRVSPRQMFEYGYTLVGPLRTFFDLMTMQVAGSPAYVPLWHELGRLTTPARIGDTVLGVDTRWTEFQNCEIAVLIHEERSNPFEYELVEIESYTDSTITITAGLTNAWRLGNRIYPVKKCKVETQPTGQRLADRAYQARVRFQSLEANKSNAESNILGDFLDNPVIEIDTNRVDLTSNYDRKWFSLDNSFGIPHQYDVSGFLRMNMQWFAKGREAHWRLRGLFYTLQGRRRPVWLSSGMADFEMTTYIGDADTTLRVKRCGYTDMGGPLNHREYIVIHLYDGTRLYRKIMGAAIVGDGAEEQLALDLAPGRPIFPGDVKRISFIDFCRLDQDGIELLHHADTKGLTTANSVFLTDPGIGGVENFLEVEVDPNPPPPEEPLPPVVVDPFRLPAGKLWLYVPSFPASDDGVWFGLWWAGRRTAEELIADNSRLPANIDDAFPPDHISGSGTFVTLPETGSFLVRAGMYWSVAFDDAPPSEIGLKIVFNNTTLPPVIATVQGSVITLGIRVQVQSGRHQIPFVERIDPDEPIVISIEHARFGPGLHIIPECNPDSDCEPYHGKADASGGDSYFVVEWWPS